MSKFKYTPRPWGAFKGDLGICIAPENSELNKKLPIVCLISDEESFNEEDKANAKLIVAAPEMLECLIYYEENLFPWLSAALEDNNVCDELKEAIRSCFALSSIIIEKAGGEVE